MDTNYIGMDRKRDVEREIDMRMKEVFHFKSIVKFILFVFKGIKINKYDTSPIKVNLRRQLLRYSSYHKTSNYSN